MIVSYLDPPSTIEIWVIHEGKKIFETSPILEIRVFEYHS